MTASATERSTSSSVGEGAAAAAVDGVNLRGGGLLGSLLNELNEGRVDDGDWLGCPKRRTLLTANGDADSLAVDEDAADAPTGLSHRDGLETAFGAGGGHRSPSAARTRNTYGLSVEADYMVENVVYMMEANVRGRTSCRQCARSARPRPPR